MVKKPIALIAYLFLSPYSCARINQGKEVVQLIAKGDVGPEKAKTNVEEPKDAKRFLSDIPKGLVNLQSSVKNLLLHPAGDNFVVDYVASLHPVAHAANKARKIGKWTKSGHAAAGEITNLAKQQRDLAEKSVVQLQQPKGHTFRSVLMNALDVKSSMDLFMDVAESQSKALEDKLSESGNQLPPNNKEECAARFDKAQVHLQPSLCAMFHNDNSKFQNCISQLSKSRQEKQPGLECQKATGKTVVSNPQGIWQQVTDDVCCSWQADVDSLKSNQSNPPTSTGVALLWKQHIRMAKRKLSKMTAEHFPSPATAALASQATIYDYAEHLNRACNKSSWTNPVGAASRLLKSWTPLGTTARNVTLEKIKELRQHVHDVTCPAVEDSACKAGCKYVTEAMSFEKLVKCRISAPPVPHASFQNEEEYRGFHIKDAYVSSYCAQLEKFSQKIAPLCQSADATFASGKGTFGKGMDLIWDGLAIYGIYSVVVTASSYLSMSDPSYTGMTGMQVSLGMDMDAGETWGTARTSFEGAYFVLGFVSSVAWTFQRSAIGLMDDSNACSKIADSIQQLTS